MWLDNRYERNWYNLKTLKSHDNYNSYKPLVPYMPKYPTPGKAYTPYQINPEYFDVDSAYAHGTLFPALVYPYQGKKFGKEVY